MSLSLSKQHQLSNNNKLSIITSSINNDLSPALSLFSNLGLLLIATPITLGSILTLFRRYIRWKLQPLRTGPLGGPNTTTSGFWFGEFFTIRQEPFMQPHLRWIRGKEQQQQKTWDNIPFIFYSLMFGRPAILVLDKDIVKEILTEPAGKEPLRFSKDSKFLKITLSEGLVTAEGTKWRRHRQIIQPAFFTTVLKESLNTTVPTLTREFVSYWKQATMTMATTIQGGKRQREIDVMSHLSSLTLDIIGRVAFSHEFRALQSVKEWAEQDTATTTTTTNESSEASSLAEVNDPLIQALKPLFKLNVIGLISLILGMPWISKYFNPVMVRTRTALASAVDQIVANAKQSLKEQQEEEDGIGGDNNASGSNTKNNTKKSLLHLLLEAVERDESEKKALTDVELRDEVTTFLFAGHDTTATWCYMAMYVLVMNPEIQDKVYQDIMKHAPSSSGQPIDLASVDKMEYFSAFLQEVLRLYSPVGLISRLNNKTDKLGGHIIPKNTRIVISAYILHRHPKYWDDPLTFKPERWMGDNKVNDERTRFAFLPFSAGGRNCIGQRFATVEAKLILSELIRSFTIELAPSQRDTKFTFSNRVVMRTEPRLKVVVTARD